MTRNTESTVRRCLDSIRDVVDEIIIVDGHSSDNTVKICRKYTDLIYSRKPKGFADPDRNYALSKASGDWVLYVDADEWLSKNLRKSLRGPIAKDDADAFSFSRVNYFLSRPPLHGLAYPDKQTRLYRREKTRYAGMVHEQPTISGRVVDTSLYILHKQEDSNALFSDRYVRYGIIYARQHPLETKRWHCLMSPSRFEIFGFSAEYADFQSNRNMILAFTTERVQVILYGFKIMQAR